MSGGGFQQQHHHSTSYGNHRPDMY
jgi:hypothetical protein